MAILALAVVIGVCVFLLQGLDRRDRALWRDQQLAMQRDADREIALVEETSSFGLGAQVSLALMYLGVGVSILMYFGAKTVFQEIEAGVSSIVSILLFGGSRHDAQKDLSGVPARPRYPVGNSGPSGKAAQHVAPAEVVMGSRPAT